LFLLFIPSLSWPANAGHPAGFCTNSADLEDLHSRRVVDFSGVTWVARIRGPRQLSVLRDQSANIKHANQEAQFCHLR
jgi:hypothetical protein